MSSSPKMSEAEKRHRNGDHRVSLDSDEYELERSVSAEEPDVLETEISLDTYSAYALQTFKLILFAFALSSIVISSVNFGGTFTSFSFVVCAWSYGIFGLLILPTKSMFYIVTAVIFFLVSLMNVVVPFISVLFTGSPE